MSHVTLRWAVLGFVALVTGLPSFWVASRPSRATSRLGMRGKKRQQALLRSPTWASAEPFVRWMGARVNGVLPPENEARIDDLLTHAGDWRGLTADELAGMMVACGVALGLLGSLLGFAFGPRAIVIACPILLVSGAMIPWLVVDSAKVTRLRTINRTLPNVIDLLALSMSAGLDFPGAVRQLVEQVLEAGVAQGRFDKPKRNQYRAIRPDPREYSSDDWIMCLTSALDQSPTEREAALRFAAYWAASNTGLAFSRLQKGGAILGGLDAALELALQRGRFVDDGSGCVRKV